MARGAAGLKQLDELIAARIAAGDGWLDFAEFMRLALFEPGLGYYASGQDPLGPKGDFITAAESSDLFGRCVAKCVAAALPHDGELLELGGGSGRLLKNILLELRELGLRPACQLLETSPAMQERQQETLRAAGLLEQCSWISSLPDSFTGVVLLFEVLDALPCSIYVYRDGTWWLRGVTINDGSLAWADGPPADAAALEQLADAPAQEHYLAEINWQAQAMIASLGAMLRRGAIIINDYGFSAAEFFHPQRSGGTLMAHSQHRAALDPLQDPGTRDLTAHVNFSAIARAAQAAQLDIAGFDTQANCLLQAGIADMVTAAEAEDEVVRYRNSRELQLLLMPQEMGDFFKFMIVGRKLEGPLPCFGPRDRSHTLLPA